MKSESMLKVAVMTLCAVRVALGSGEVAAPAQFDEARQFIQQGIDAKETPSVAVALVKDDRVIWAEGFGYADLEKKIPATPDSIYILASISKPITATGLMILKDRGLIDLDAPANRYLPGPKLRAYAGSADEMTIRRLANHTSGLPLHYSFFYDNVAPHTMDEAIERYGFAATSPGSAWQYSNLAFGILDYITESVAKTPWREFMEKNVYDPLKMTRTSDRVRPGREADATRRYTKDVAGRFIPVALYGFDHDGASAISTSANDLARFARMHLNGGILEGVRILTPETTREMQVRTSNADRPSDTGNGIAWFVNEYYGQPSIEHSGGMPGVSTRLRLFPKSGVAVVVLTNSDHSTFAKTVVDHIAHVLFPEGKSVDPKPEKEADTGPADFVGRWEGRLVHYDGDIPTVLEIDGAGKAKVKLGAAAEVELKEVSFKRDRFTGWLEGNLRTQPSYHGPVKLELQLRKAGERMTGVSVATATDYFALSHWTELKRIK